MAYTKQTWADLPSKTTPINANRLTHIEDGIFNAAQTADTAASTAGTAAANVGIVSGKVETLTERVNGLDTAVSNKVDKVAGKGLSENDFTNTLKSKLDGIASGAEVNVQSDWNEADSSSDAFILNKPTLGTASTKNSTSVVTQSTDLVESGAVYDALGFGNKNRLPLAEYSFIKNSARTVAPRIKMPLLKAGDKIKVQLKLKDVSGVTTGEENTAFFARVGLHYDYARAVFFNTSLTDTQTLELRLEDDVPSLDDQVLYIGIPNSATGNPSMTAYEIMVSYDGGAYEPYHASVEESLEQKCDNSVIGTVEGANASKAWSVGEHFIKDGQFKEVTQPIASGGEINDSNTVDRPIADVLDSKVSIGRLITSADDLDTIFDIGIHRVSTVPTHSPESSGYCTLEVLPASTASFIQRIQKANIIYTRFYNTNNQTWESWNKYAGTVIS